MKKTFGIIGYGRFGQLWAKHLGKLGDVLVYDVKKIKEQLPKNCTSASLQEVARSNVLFFAVPISKLESSIKVSTPFIPRDTIVADVSSVKLFPAEILKKCLPKGQAIVGTHPLFGPDSAGGAKTLAGFKIAVAPIKISKEKLDEFLDILSSLGLEIILTTAKTHDRQMANSQGLIHFIGRGFEGLGLKPQAIATKDYASLLHIKDMVVNDTWQLFLDMHRYNRLTVPVREKFIARLLEIEETLTEDTPLTLKAARNEIDRIDKTIIKALAKRAGISQKIGRIKKETVGKITDKNREIQLKKMHSRTARELGLAPSEVAKVFKSVVAYSKKIQSNEH